MTTVELRLSGTAVRALADNGHIPGWPTAADPARVRDDDPDADLHRALARWFSGTVERRSGGRGRIHRGPASPADAAEILGYLESLAGALLAAEGPEHADTRTEGRAIARALASAIAHMRRAGVAVMEERYGFSMQYRIMP